MRKSLSWKSTPFNHFNCSIVYNFLKQNSLLFPRFKLKFFSITKVLFHCRSLKCTATCTVIWVRAKRLLLHLEQQQWPRIYSSTFKKAGRVGCGVHTEVGQQPSNPATVSEKITWMHTAAGSNLKQPWWEILPAPTRVLLSWEEFHSDASTWYSSIEVVVSFFFCLFHHGALRTNTEGRGAQDFPCAVYSAQQPFENSGWFKKNSRLCLVLLVNICFLGEI